MSYTFDSINNFIPEDLLINPTAEKIAANNALDKDVFTYTEPNLKVNSVYLFQFKYIFEDGSESDEWSPAYTLLTKNIAAPAAVSGVTPAWSGTNFTLTFTHDPSNSSNEYLKEYLITLNTATSGTKIFSLLPVSGTTQKFALSLAQNQAAFGTSQKAFSGTIQTLDIYGNKGSAISFANTAYVSALVTPTITVSAITNGYSVSYPTQTSNTFQFISVEEVVSNASTDPGTGYAGVATGTSNPLVVPTVDTNKRWVRAKLFDTVNDSTGYSTAVAVTPLSPFTVDNEGPPNVASVTTSGGLDSSGIIGFNGYSDISWTSVTTGGIRGYRIRYRPVTTPASNYSYADSPGSGTAYRLAGLGAGLTYEIAVATYDEYNNTSSNYVAGSNVSVGGTPYIASTVDVTGYFSAKASPTDAASTAFKFGYGVDTGKRGLVFNANNYWYIDSSQSASLKVGGATTNYIEWNGSSFVIDGDMRAKKGSFSGNVSIASGASIYSGTLTGNTVTSTEDTGGSLFGAGYMLNSSGLTFNSSTVSGITTINALTGLLTTSSANIGGWLISPSTNVGSLYKTSGTNTVKLDSAGYITVSGTGYETGIGYPSSSGADANIVIWAGATKATAPFKVFKDGSVILSAATITGYASSGDLSNYATTSALSTGLSGKINTGGAASDVNSNVTTISGGKIRTGSIQSTTWSGTVTNGSDYSTNGMNINLDNAGSITAKNFRIDESGNAFFKGTLSSGISIDAPVIAGGQINIGNGTFQVTTSGVLTASSATITGTIRATSGYIGNATDGWNFNSAGYMHDNTFNTILYPKAGLGGTSNTYALITDRAISGKYIIDTGSTSATRSEFNYFNIINRISISSGYGVDTDWSPQSDNTYNLGQATSAGYSTNRRWQRLYSNNTTISTSDQRLKTNIENSSLGLNFINSLRPVSFKWIEGKKEVVRDSDGNEVYAGDDENGKPMYETISIPGVRHHYGFIAQEVKEAVDESGVQDFAGWVQDDLTNPDSYQSLSYEQFIAPLTKAIQEISNKINLIESRLDDLEG